MDNIKDIGKRIKKERTRIKGLTLDVLAEKISVTRQTISKWEKGGGGGPTVWDLEKMCAIFGCDYGYLIGDYECRTRTATDIRDETGLSELAVANLLVAAGGPDEGPMDERDANNVHDNLRAREIGRFAKIRFIEALLENSDELERMAVAAYDYRDHMRKFEQAPLQKVEGITHDQFAGIAKEEAKEALSALLQKLSWDITSIEFTGK